jgi:hypothetical protein
VDPAFESCDAALTVAHRPAAISAMMLGTEAMPSKSDSMPVTERAEGDAHAHRPLPYRGEFPPAIPRRVAPQQSPLPLRRIIAYTSSNEARAIPRPANLSPISLSQRWGAVHIGSPAESVHRGRLLLVVFNFLPHIMHLCPYYAPLSILFGKISRILILLLRGTSKNEGIPEVSWGSSTTFLVRVKT